MQLFNLIFVIASAFAACPAETKISAAKILVANVANGLNQKALGLLANAIASEDATCKFTPFLRGKCEPKDYTYAALATDIMTMGLKVVSMNITDAYNTAVGYTVVETRFLGSDGAFYNHQFQFMDAKDNCALELIYCSIVDERCAGQ